ncbi:MAG: hypothetical protein ACM3UZ_03540 [Acidobacteriota bacterium]
MSKMSLKDFCEAGRVLALSGKEPEETVIEGQLLLAELLANPDFLLDNMSALTESPQDDDYLPIDINDITIYRDPLGHLSIRLFVWEPHVQYPVHDHSSWGIMGCLKNELRETKYRRLDDGSKGGYADLAVQAEAVLRANDTTFVLPYEKGIHRMMCHGSLPALSVHAYGKRGSRFINGYVPEQNAVYRMYPMKLHRRILAIKALETMRSDWACEILKFTAKDHNEVVRQVAKEALENIKKSK